MLARPLQGIDLVEGGEIKAFIDNPDLEQEIYLMDHFQDTLLEVLTFGDTITSWAKEIRSSHELDTKFLPKK